MINLTLTTRSTEQKELHLPLCAKDILEPHLGSYLAYGTASVAFETPSHELRSLLTQAIPETMHGGVEELNLLAFILDNMNGQQLQLLEKSMAENECDFTKMMHRVFYFGCHAFNKNGSPNPNAKPLEEYSLERNRLSLEGFLKSKLSKELEAQRLTGGALFLKIIEQARANNDMDHFDAIAEYVLPEDYEKGKLCRYEFDLMPVVNFGGSEGIYVDCYLKGTFDESENKSMRIGTIKTLSDDLDACKTMGELCGALLYHENKYVNENLTRFDSLEAIERMLKQPLKMEVEQAQTNSLTQQMI